MSYTLKVPTEIKRAIGSWGLPRHLLVQLYTDLHELAPVHETECMRTAALVPTFVYVFELYDTQQKPLVIHSFTFWFTYGEQDDVLYIRDCTHRTDEPGDSPDYPP